MSAGEPAFAALSPVAGWVSAMLGHRDVLPVALRTAGNGRWGHSAEIEAYRDAHACECADGWNTLATGYGGAKSDAPSPADRVTSMITGELKAKVDRVWDAFWSGGISNPIEVIEQLTYLLFVKGLDEAHVRGERKANRTGQPIEEPIFPEGEFQPDGATKPRPYADLRWKNLKSMGSAAEMYEVVDKYVFPFLHQRAADSTHARHMKDARLSIPTPGLLQKAVDGIDAIPMDDRDTKGDVYEYMLSKIATAGQNGQFRTPRHIIQLMVAMTAPTPDDVICDPASGTCGFLVAASEHIRDQHPFALTDPARSLHFHGRMFHGYDFDNTMLRIGSMNMQLHGVENPAIEYRDSLAEDHAGDIEAYSLVLANPPFAGSLDYESTAKDLLQLVKTKKTELLFLALFLRLLKPGGRGAVIVPDGVLFGSTKAHKALRRMLVEDQKLDGIVSLPSGVFKPYAGVSTAILLFTKTNSGGTDHVWFYDLQADGYGLDDKRTPLLPDNKLGVDSQLTDDEHAKNNLPDVLARWNDRDGTERDRERTSQSFCVPRVDIAANDYDLSINRYKEIVYDEIEYPEPEEILDELTALEEDIQKGIDELRAML
jgi:type I restriction enzyme M protein